jgi:type I restriction enzyme S subunit
MTSEWQQKRFGECAVPVRETVSPEELLSTNYVGLEHIGEGSLALIGHGVTGDVTSAKSRFRRGDILFGKLRPYFRKVVRAPSDGVCSTDIWVVRPRDGIDPSYLFYWMASEEFVAAATQGSDGTKMPRAQWEYVSKFMALVPSFPEQRAIAHILGALDDKIELNRRMNETLEAMARALFKSWFIDFDPVHAKAEGRDPGLPADIAALFPNSFEDSGLGEIPKGWSRSPLGDYFRLGIGGAWGEDEFSERASAHVRCLRGIDCHNLAEGRIPNVPTRWLSARQVADRALTEGTILIEGSGSFCGRSVLWDSCYDGIIRGPVSYSNFCKRLDPICTTSQAIVCWLQMRRAYRAGELQVFRIGTAFPNFDVHGALANQLVIAPTPPIADLFAGFFRASRRTDLMAQSNTLAILRDTLLPKLLSGELRVKGVDQSMEAHV